MSRYFTLAEAEEMLPAVERFVRQAQTVRDEFQQAEAVFQNHNRRIALSGGTFVNLNRVHALRDQRQSALKKLKSVIETLSEAGCQLKDLDMGLIDFPTMYRGEEVLMCWKLGETGIRYWHGTTEGYQGRKEIDDHFRANHGGDDDASI